MMDTDKRLRKKRATRIGALMCFAGILALAMAGQRTGPVTARVERVIDGDTLIVRYQGESHTVRLSGVDTPESAHPTAPVEHFGAEAAAFTKAPRLSRQTAARTSTLPSFAKATAMRFAVSITRCAARASRSRIRRAFRGGACGHRVRSGDAEHEMLGVFPSLWPRSAPSSAIPVRDIEGRPPAVGGAFAW